MAKESQGCLIRRESSVAGTTAAQESTNTISFDSTLHTICRQAGFAAFSTGMRIAVEASLNRGAFTIKTTAATAIGVYETLVAQASGGAVSITGHTMQNIGEVVSFNGPSMSAAIIDVTNLASTAKEKLIGVYDAGQVSISVLFDEQSSGAKLHDALIRDMTARTKRQMDVIFKGNSTLNTQAVYFGGYVSGFSITGAVDNAIKADITVALASGVNFLINRAT